MPSRIAAQLSDIERLEILDETGRVDADLEPDLTPDQLMDLYRGMLTARLFDERMLQLQRQGRIGTFAPIKGQEAANMGAVVHLRSSDWLVPSFRETAAQLWRGMPMETIWFFSAGYNEAFALPPDSRDLPLCVPVASQLLHATGIAYAAKLRGLDEIVMAFCGDGATSSGDFHEALNFAAVWKVPVVFIVQNNHWAISVPLAKQTAAHTLAQKAVAYAMPSVQVDGNDVLAVWEGARRAVAHARSGHGPMLVECVTYRMSVHTTADDPTKYRDEEEVALWEKRDPIQRVERYLADKGILSQDQRETVTGEIKQTLRDAWARVEARVKEVEAAPPEELFDHLYAETPPHLEEQRREFLQHIKEGRIRG
ncbi:MAG: pyruvate dehydrogenase (acetyl-transferring) E1 component subunit alpha [Rhodothalassiaceae bacterium]